MKSGQTLAHYEIIRPLGKGGMGEVYLAQDTKLKREVAVKVLPASVRSDEERLRRFRREAEAAAKLKHNNIATIHALEEVDNTTFIVMEYVEGKTLTELIPSEGMDLDTFLATFIPLADALSHAHEHSRVHLDLKPGNIMVTQGGIPKILDFGLAHIERESVEQSELDSAAPTMTIKAENVPDASPSLTQGRGFLGTPAYMSPEQIENKQIDARSDLFSFGIVMYEALTGQRPFKGENIESIIGRILTEDPTAVTELRPITPHQLWWTIRKSLVKNREKRYQMARDLHTDLEAVQAETQAGTVLVDANTIPKPEPGREPESPPDPVPYWRQPAAIGFAVVMLIVGLSAAWLLKPVPEMLEPPLRKFTLAVESMNDGGGTVYTGPVVSPDGRTIVYQQGDWTIGTLWIRDLDTVTPRELPDTEGATRPFWSPGSDFVAYFVGTAQGELRKVAVSGGPSIPLCDVPNMAIRGGVWLPDGTIVFGVGFSLFNDGGSLYRVSSQGGEPIVFATADSSQGQRGLIYPTLLPDGSLMYAATMGEGAGGIIAQQAENRRVLLSNRGERVAFPVYSPTGHILYQRGFPESRGIWAVPFDGTQVTGESFPVDAEGGYPTVSSDGTLVYRNAVGGTSHRQLVWVDRQGNTEPVGALWEILRDPALSPDGKRVAFTASSQGSWDIWIYDLERDITTRLTFDPGVETAPVWSPDGRWVAFESSGSNDNDIYVKAADGSGNAALLVGGPGRNTPYAWSRDGRYLIYRNIAGTGDLWYATLQEKEGTIMLDGSQPFLQTQFSEWGGSFSPDERYLAYASDESGQNEIYVRPFPEGKSQWQVSSNGGRRPLWQGNELFYYNGTDIMTVQVETNSTFLPGRADKLFDFPGVTPFSALTTTISTDGRRFLVVQNAGDAVQSQKTTITVVENWIKEFEGRQ